MSALLNFGIIPGSFGLFYTLAKHACGLKWEEKKHISYTHPTTSANNILKKIFIDTISNNMKINFKPLVYIKLVSTV